MGLKPLNDSVLIQPDPPKEYKEYAKLEHIVVPEAYKWGPVDQHCYGTVVSKGDKCTRQDVPLGARVVYAKYGWAKVPQAEGYLALLRERDILAVVTDE